MLWILFSLLACDGEDSTKEENTPIESDDSTESDEDTETDTNDTDEPDSVQQPWPDWAYHHWVWEDESTQESLFEMVDGYLDRDIPVGAIIIDSPWATGYSTYEWDESFFADPQWMIDELHDRGIKVMLWTVPVINIDEVELYEEAASNGYFLLKEETGEPMVFSWWKGDGSLIDYFNPDAVEWWHDLIQPVLDMGIDGWKCDGAEYSLMVSAGYSPVLGRKVERLEYSHAYYNDFFYFTRDVLGEERLITARPIDNYGADIGGDVVSFAPIEINWAAWVGDQDPDFNGLKMALRNMYWSADYGYVAFGSDIGGYRTDDAFPNGREKEPFLRWAQQGAFVPVMENGGAGGHWPWLFDDETVSIYRDFVNLHYAILPYLHKQASIAFAEGRSVVEFTDDERYSYLLGPDIFVAPILEKDGHVSLTLPEGEWVYLFDSSQSYSGEESLEMQIPLDEFSVFVRQGSEIAGELLE